MCIPQIAAALVRLVEGVKATSLDLDATNSSSYVDDGKCLRMVMYCYILFIVQLCNFSCAR